MSDTDGVLWAFTLPELLGYLLALAVIVGSLLGATTLFSGYSAALRTAAAVAIAVQLAAPLAVYFDCRRRGDSAGIWVHVAAVPVIGIFGLIAYCESR